ncbi:hypothetical protein SLEP1_g59588 [Rubroshorea leprosula]|uniref:Uncharacterized protein n=1 Tax=Rubroshorea leprosula TaxID=152421 RepID=A0AAV5MSR7_9ROSI|nr:hypothetical protein SLEP1_g59588 [Rubroshorea leprosula]
MHRRGILWKYTTGGLNFLDFWKEAPLKEALGVFDFSHFPVWEIRNVNGKSPRSHPIFAPGSFLPIYGVSALWVGKEILAPAPTIFPVSSHAITA